jgi:hypothetical protein
MRIFDVFLDGAGVDSIFCGDGISPGLIREQLITRQGFDPAIQVRERPPERFQTELAGQIAALASTDP